MAAICFNHAAGDGGNAVFLSPIWFFVCGAAGSNIVLVWWFGTGTHSLNVARKCLVSAATVDTATEWL